jgi:cbb3-type cytochrome oxidase subunit 3
MTLTDLMSGAGLSSYAVIALILFFGTFIALIGWIWWPSRKAEWNSDALIPLHEATPSTQEHR